MRRPPAQTRNSHLRHSPVRHKQHQRQHQTEGQSAQLRAVRSDLLDFFQSIITLQCLSKADLFRPEVTIRGMLRSKLASFGKAIAADSLVKHCQDFCKPTVPHAVKDAATVVRTVSLFDSEAQLPMVCTSNIRSSDSNIQCCRGRS